MHSLRRSTILHRLVLVWFLAFMGSAIAAPMLHPQRLEVICSSMGGGVMVQMDDGTLPSNAGGMNCPLCTPNGLPPSPIPPEFDMPMPLGHVMALIPAAHIAAATAAPLPARGPPHTL